MENEGCTQTCGGCISVLLVLVPVLLCPLCAILLQEINQLARPFGGHSLHPTTIHTTVTTSFPPIQSHRLVTTYAYMELVTYPLSTRISARVSLCLLRPSSYHCLTLTLPLEGNMPHTPTQRAGTGQSLPLSHSATGQTPTLSPTHRGCNYVKRGHGPERAQV